MNTSVDKNIYENIRTTVAEAQNKVYCTVNFVMVETYWNIGKQIFEAQGENERADYGSYLLEYISVGLRLLLCIFRKNIFLHFCEIM